MGIRNELKSIRLEVSLISEAIQSIGSQPDDLN